MQVFVGIGTEEFTKEENANTTKKAGGEAVFNKL